MKLFKLMLVFCIFVSLTGCINGNVKSGANDNSVNTNTIETAPPIKSEITSSPSHETAPAISDDEVIKKIPGEYFSLEALEKFKETRSAIDSFGGLSNLRIEELDGKYQILVGDGHQGVPLGTTEKIEKSENGNYVLNTYENENNYCRAEYSYEADTLTCTLKTTFPSISDEKTITFLRFDTGEDLTAYLSGILFENSDGVEFIDDSVYAVINEEKYNLHTDFDIVDADMYFSCMGRVYLYRINDNGHVLAFYKYENKVISLYDENENILATYSVK